MTTPKDPLGSAWMIIAALSFTVMNVCIKAAAAKFGFNSGELVFWRMSFAAVVLGIMAKARGDTFATPHWKTHLNRSVVGTAAMFCLFYAVMHLPLATGVTLSYTSSIFLAVFSFFILKERIAFYTQAVEAAREKINHFLRKFILFFVSLFVTLFHFLKSDVTVAFYFTNYI